MDQQTSLVSRLSLPSQGQIVQLCREIGFNVEYMNYKHDPYRYSRSNLIINGYKCRILRRSSAVYHKFEYIEFSVSTSYVRKFDFILLLWEAGIGNPSVYIIPTTILTSFKDLVFNNGLIRKQIYIPINHAPGITARVDWRRYENSWDQLKKPHPS